MTRFLSCTFALALPALALPAAWAQVPASQPAQAPAPESAPAATPTPSVKPRVQLLTSYGPIVVELEPELAPKTVENFLRYVKEGHYKGTIFHRVIDGFMIQGGGMLENLEEKPTHEPILNEVPQTFKAGLKNSRGTIAMARQDNPQSATAQFYINVADNPSLDPQGMQSYGYCAFGHVISGMEAVDKISKVKTEWRRGQGDIPQFPVRIKDAILLPPQ
ncbi:peptidyl-prolyl cis-trans isomerase [Geothrix limicola]|uniref:Peptidyl-prolyl cis-trans isomerase n=1 Tax=Geothrix limicola TaxID=2927978 RepID=A0ABQ5QDU9_9BACT|nr:peptidylprolyl isomerase [Geothrix limicola]GLH72812.1 peptidyl-prolyl cis-trans isomerase [Geothrix limicola]